jgi:1,4-alpha-glucan branching enzyme
MAKNSTFQLIKDDPWLAPYQDDIQQRTDRYLSKSVEIKKDFDTLYSFATRDEELGFNYDDDKKGWFYREWAPAAQSLSLIGDFNAWDRSSHKLKKDKYGIWEIFIPDMKDGSVLKHEQLVKVHVTSSKGSQDRIPAYIKRVVQDEETHAFAGQIWKPKKEFKWSGESFVPAKTPFIYEAHIGMSQEKEGVGSYSEFTKNTLPRIKKLGYNTIQLMAIMEHPYYGSFGYHVSNFFAPTSRFGTPEELKELIQEAHQMGIAVVIDIVHSHAVKNIAEGLNNFDGSGHQYFHAGERGNQEQWDSKVFDYSNTEVLRFLLSNLRYWMEEFHFDGFRFDGVTSMLYHHHGSISFDHYDKYFKEGVEWDAVTYLKLANELIHKINPNAISIAEDMSGMPGLCRPIKDGGIGFDFRLAMGIPDYWIKLLKHSSDEDWNINEIFQTLTDRRYKEKTIAYTESHDQALVGDKTLAFWLMDKDMYWHMSKGDDSLVIDRGIALHKIIRTLTATLGGESYMTFMGNEFGHPEWVDFPREGNDWSYKYCRRQWNLLDNNNLKYEFMNNWEIAMVSVLREHHVLAEPQTQQLNMDDHNKTMIYKIGDLLFIINMHPSNSVFDYNFFVPESGTYDLILNSDEQEFGGFNRITKDKGYETVLLNGVPHLSIYNINRAILVFKKR